MTRHPITASTAHDPACAGAPIGSFYPPSSSTEMVIAATSVARTYCAHCPLLTACAEWADQRGEQGLWGGSLRGRDGHHRRWALPLIPGAPTSVPIRRHRHRPRPPDNDTLTPARRVDGDGVAVHDRPRQDTRVPTPAPRSHRTTARGVVVPRPGSTADRGYGTEHQAVRRALLVRHVDGTPCPCGEDCGSGCPCRPHRAIHGHGLPMYRDPARNVDRRPLQADHTRPRSTGGARADRLLLARCNLGRGARLGNEARGLARHPERQRQRSTAPDW